MIEAEVRGRFRVVSEAELADGLRRMRADEEAAGPEWVDPRPTWFMTARKAAESTV